MLSIRNASAVTAFAVVFLVLGCQSQRSHEPMTADLERDLSLATSTRAPRTGTVSSLELGGSAASDDKPGVRLAVPIKRRAPSPAKSHMVAEIPILTAPASVADPASAPAVEAQVASSGAGSAVANEPQIYMSPAPSGPSAGDGSVGRGDGARRGAGGGTGGIIGAIIRGTSVGVDNCEPAGVGAHGRLGHPGVVGTILGGIDRTNAGGKCTGCPLSALLVDDGTVDRDSPTSARYRRLRVLDVCKVNSRCHQFRWPRPANSTLPSRSTA